MQKSDKSLKNICIAAIKRSTIPPFDFLFTKIHEDENTPDNKNIKVDIGLEGEEQYICSTIIDDKTWTILTTKRIVSSEGMVIVQHSLIGLEKWDFGDFKGHAGQTFTKGHLSFSDRKSVPIFVETGRASMVMIYGIRSLLK